ncbi:MAG: class I SAM-dependent methyltransferase family protein [Methanosphaera sp.]|nr:class I SAM-dependent methyltransferase family protein [Methanosphaera sp.]
MKGIKIIKKQANDVRVILLSNKQLCTKYKVRNDKDYVYLPLITDYDEGLIEKIRKEYPIEVNDYDYKQAQYRPTNFMDYLTDKIDEEKIEDIRKSFDIIGDIVILEIPDELEEYKKVIGQAALKFTKRRSVYRKKSKVQGVMRTRELEYLAGIDDLETIHKEYSLRFKLNPSTVYYSPRLATERSRIVKQVHDNEVIIDFFAGIGSFTVSIAHVKNVTAYNIDINPEAIRYAQENIKLNKLVGKVIPILGDVRDVADTLEDADRIIMNLPGTSKDFLPLAVSKLKSGGILNYYEFASCEDVVIKHVKEANENYDVEIMGIRKVKSQSPGVWHYGVDAKIIK